MGFSWEVFFNFPIPDIDPSVWSCPFGSIDDIMGDSFEGSELPIEGSEDKGLHAFSEAFDPSVGMEDGQLFGDGSGGRIEALCAVLGLRVAFSFRVGLCWGFKHPFWGGRHELEVSLDQGSL